MSLPSRRQTVSFAPITGPSGYSLTGYVWQYDLIEYVDQRGEDRVRKVSDWDRAASADVTGRDIVHQFTVIAPGGAPLLVSLESAAKLLGFAAGSAGASTVRSVASAVKTLAKLRMELASIEAQNAALAPKNAEHAADLARLTAEYEGRQPTVVAIEDGVEEWEMDGKTGWHRPSKFDGRWERENRANQLEFFKRCLVRDKMKALGHTGGLHPASVIVGDLPERIRRQEQKIKKMTC